MANGLPWIRFDTTLPDHPKVLELLGRKDGHRAAFVYCCALAYAGRHGTDGFIPSAALDRLHGRRVDAQNLVTVGLFDPDPEAGWHIHGYDEYQQTTGTTEKVREQKRRASVKGNCVRHHGDQCGCWKTATLRAV